jgi:hypothetical protein
MAKLSKTQQKLNTVLDRQRNYKKLREKTGLESKRLSEIRSGKVKPTRSEVGKISRYKVEEAAKRRGETLGIKDIIRITGFREATVRKVLSSGAMKITKKKIDTDTSILLKTKENVNYRLGIVVYINLKGTKGYTISLIKRLDYKLLGNTATTIDHYWSEYEVGQLYAVTITAYRIGEYQNLKETITAYCERIIQGDNEYADIELLYRYLGGE